jgi:hypothetical protein
MAIRESRWLRVGWGQGRCPSAERSVAFIRSQLHELPGGPVRADVAALKPDHFAVSLVDGWRGEICHVAITDGQGRFARYKIVDLIPQLVRTGAGVAGSADLGLPAVQQEL